MLRAELPPGRAGAGDRAAPPGEPLVRARGDSDAAVRHARAAGDLDRAATLVWAAVPDRLGRGDVAAIERSLAPFSHVETAARAPLALAAAWCALERGADTAEDWIAAAQQPGDRVRASPAAVALLRAAAGVDTPLRMRADVDLALHSAPEGSPWRAMARLHEGIAHDLAGDPAAARAALDARSAPRRRPDARRRRALPGPPGPAGARGGRGPARRRPPGAAGARPAGPGGGAGERADGDGARRLRAGARACGTGRRGARRPGPRDCPAGARPRPVGRG